LPFKDSIEIGKEITKIKMWDFLSYGSCDLPFNDCMEIGKEIKI
jgi:hypothetical protein